MGNYALGYAFDGVDLFYNFDNKKMKMSTNDCKKIKGDGHRDRLALSIFLEHVNDVLEDIVTNNVTFNLPTKGRQSRLYVKRYSGDMFTKLRQLGKWEDINFLTSNFSGYQMVFEYKSGGVDLLKPCYLHKKLRDIITNNTNSGFQYC